MTVYSHAYALACLLARHGLPGVAYIYAKSYGEPFNVFPDSEYRPVAEYLVSANADEPFPLITTVRQ